MANNKFRIAIVGVGGVGGYLGTKLANRYADDGGVDIVFIQRGDHLHAIKRNGLRYITKNNTYTVIPTLATDDPRETGKIDLAIICVKSYNLQQTATQIATSLKNDSVILSTLNGLQHLQTRMLNLGIISAMMLTQLTCRQSLIQQMTLPTSQ